MEGVGTAIGLLPHVHVVFTSFTPHHHSIAPSRWCTLLNFATRTSWSISTPSTVTAYACRRR